MKEYSNTSKTYNTFGATDKLGNECKALILFNCVIFITDSAQEHIMHQIY